MAVFPIFKKIIIYKKKLKNLREPQIKNLRHFQQAYFKIYKTKDRIQINK